MGSVFFFWVLVGVALVALGWGIVAMSQRSRLRRRELPHQGDLRTSERPPEERPGDIRQ